MRVPRVPCRLTPDGDWLPGAGDDGELTIWPFTQHWAHPYRTRDPRRVDPVNLFVRDADPQRLMSDLAPREWSRPDDGQTHCLWVKGRPHRMTDHIAAGTKQDRFHARMWALGGGTVLAVHEEYLNDAGRHVVVSWTAARERLSADLEACGFEPLAPSAQVSPANLRGLPGDGRIWRLRG
jgi:hypothetical protein